MPKASTARHAVGVELVSARGLQNSGIIQTVAGEFGVLPGEKCANWEFERRHLAQEARVCGRFCDSILRPARDWTGWLRCQDSNSQMAL